MEKTYEIEIKDGKLKLNGTVYSEGTPGALTEIEKLDIGIKIVIGALNGVDGKKTLTVTDNKIEVTNV